MVIPDGLIVFHKLDGMPPQIIHVSVVSLKYRLHLGYLVFNPGRIFDHRALWTFLVVMDHRMHQHIQTGPLSCRYRYYRNGAEHLRKTVKIDLHSTFFHNIHHIKGQNDGLSQFD